jgi:subtilase family serine protease
MSSGPVVNSNTPTPEELEVKAAELEARRLEAARALAVAKSSWWRRADPLVLAILAGALTLLGNMSVALWNSHSSIAQEKNKAADDLKLEQTKAHYNLVLQAMATSDAATAKRNIHFFIDAGLLDDDNCKIRNALEQDQPVLPSLSGTAPPTPPGLHSAPEIASLYNFPPGLDGRGETIGVLEFGGKVNSADLAAYFKSLNLPVPDITSVSMDGPKNNSSDADTQVMLDTEVVGSIAPRARIRVYFLPFKGSGFTAAMKQAETDHVAVLFTGWGQPESQWGDDEIKETNTALQDAAQHGITVLATAGDAGVTDGVNDGRRHVDFPASSPWVLAVGGTTLKSANGHIESETAWNSSNGAATGGGVSEKFDRPAWQSATPVPRRDDGSFGRGIPDVAASASPENGLSIIAQGRPAVLGGSSVAVPIFAGLITLIDQGVGYSIGYLNPSLYQEMGPAGVFRAITSGDNGVNGVKGYTAGPGWNAVTGWGRPDGSQLLDWLRTHPTSNHFNSSVTTPCQPLSK